MREVTRGQLTGPDRERVEALVVAAAEADGHVPLSEEARLATVHGRPGSTHLIEHGAAGAVLGYAYVAAPDAPDAEGRATADHGRSCELVIAPEARGAGLGTLLARDALSAGATRFWAHGAHPAARRVAARLGLVEARELRLLELTGWAASALSPKPPAGVSIRAFEPGRDEQAWLALNSDAFAHHPEQGQWSRADLDERLREPWFDPAGFFLAERAGAGGRELIGFHWTKAHPSGEYAEEPVGEVYVLGVSPKAQGLGLGRVLLHAGMAYLTARGLRTVVLYVDGDNPAAVRLYEGAGFRTRSVDLEYRVR
jgi:mycothiol synthase